jgi:hypothetical protein
MNDIQFSADELDTLREHGVALFADRVIFDAQPPMPAHRISAIQAMCAGPLPEPLLALWRLTAGGRLDYDLALEMNGNIENISWSELFWDGSDGYRDLQGWIEHHGGEQLRKAPLEVRLDGGELLLQQPGMGQLFPGHRENAAPNVHQSGACGVRPEGQPCQPFALQGMGRFDSTFEPGFPVSRSGAGIPYGSQKRSSNSDNKVAMKGRGPPDPLLPPAIPGGDPLPIACRQTPCASAPSACRPPNHP